MSGGIQAGGNVTIGARLCALLILQCVIAACAEHREPLARPIVPEERDWVDCGAILHAGAPGTWDAELHGGFALAAILANDSVYLYYQGARGYDDHEATVTWRSVGLAVSGDGLSFEKFAGNPVLTWFPHENLEEGAVSTAAFTDTSGDVVIYYGANSWIGGQLVSADGRLAVSRDRYRFVDGGIALDHNSRTLWGAGDEIFPIIAFREGERTVVYFVPNGTLQRGRLGVAWGDGQHLNRSGPARSGLARVRAWGSGSAARLEADRYALFITSNRGGSTRHVEVRTVSPREPDKLSRPLARYHIDGLLAAAVALDRRRGRWLMYYRVRDSGEYRVRIAPWRESAGSPTPGIPGGECQKP